MIYEIAKATHRDDDVIEAGEARVVILEGMIAPANEELTEAMLTRDAVRLQAATHEERLELNIAIAAFDSVTCKPNLKMQWILMLIQQTWHRAMHELSS